MRPETTPVLRAYADEIEVGTTYEFTAYTVAESDVVRFVEQWGPQ